MSSTGFSKFDLAVEKANHVLGKIEDAYGWPKERRNQSYDALRAVLHALRDRLAVQEATDLAAQLPVLIRGIYYEDWKPSKVPVKMDRQEFLNRVKEEFPYAIEGELDGLVMTVLAALREHITEGELEDVKTNLPKDLTGLLG